MTSALPLFKRKEYVMPIIQSNTGIITQINVFTTPEGGQDALISYLSNAARIASGVDGWISASLHKCRDGRRVVNYAQSADMDAAQRVIRHLMSEGVIAGNKEFAQASPGLYDVVFTLEH